MPWNLYFGACHPLHHDTCDWQNAERSRPSPHPHGVVVRPPPVREQQRSQLWIKIEEPTAGGRC